ncbi:FMN-dependent NADH-azoreductase [Roseateles amylovorans]|jgi:FMN-dependent NADH-azoreductase|uniref:FMN dependent NADH:quinone oxidoreductase n=1 Tax=Roseateles amylovorans TaxID=2978473 RepID=A0ABY6AXD6_9BURK|nr:NAD(P)H-dependent oxidoreductase [Roseateles amylovorans]UXH77849.1 NAD(P)H-dependent oxidoreductase [Roseateles amylovorans]
MNILQINSSARRLQDGQGSVSTLLANEVVQALTARNAGAKTVVHDLSTQPLPPMDEAALGALFTPADQRTEAQQARVAVSDQLIAELMAADVVVLAAPMINFGVSSQLKNWIDGVARAGVTFRYGANGPEGLVTGKKVIVVSSRGGVHRGQPSDNVVPYLKVTLAFLGMTDVEFVYAEGLNMGPEAAAAGLASARAEIAALLGEAQAA